MKKLIHAALCTTLLLFVCHCTLAQSDSLYTDSVSPYNHKYMMDSCFADVDLSSLPTGLLIEKALSTVNVHDFKGQLTDSNYSNMFLWRRAYGTLRRAFVDSTQAYDSVGVVVARMKTYLDGGVVPIAVLNYFYEALKDSVFEDSLLTMDEEGIQLHDVDGAAESAFTTQRCFIACIPFMETDTTQLSFTLPQDLYITNDTSTVTQWQVDFGDGSGFRNINIGDTIVISYDTSSSERTIVVRAELNFLTDLRSHTNFTINEVVVPEGYSFKRDEHYYYEGPSTDLYEGGNANVHVFVHYHCKNDLKKLLRPFIVVTGYVPPKLTDIMYQAKEYPDGGGYFFNSFYYTNQTVFAKLKEQEYDLVFVTFENAGDYIQRNAKVLKQVIKELNALKKINGSNAPNVLLGQSMGGLVSRYALGEMHGEHVANPTAKPDHDVRIFYTQDSPHHGVNIAMSLQALTYHHYVYHFVKNNHVSRTELKDLEWDYLSLTSTSGRQMVINSIFADNSLHATLYSELESVAPVSGLGCKSVFISDGSGDVVKQYKIDGSTTDYLDPNDLITEANFLLNPNRPVKKIVTFMAWATPDNSSLSKTVFYGAFFTKINNRTAYYYKGYAGAVSTQWNGLDGMPGSYAKTTKSLVGGYVLTTYGIKAKIHFAEVCFIPSISGISVTAANKTNYEYPINANQSTQTFNYKRHITFDEPGNTNTSGVFNYNHARFTSYSASQFLHDIVNTAPATIGSGQGFNYARPVSDRIGNCTVQAGGLLGINNDEQAGATGDAHNNSYPASGSMYRVETIQYIGCSTQTSTITVEGNLVLGDNTNSLSGELVIRPDSKLILKNGANVTLHNNSKLIIQENAELEIEDGVTFNLIDANSEVVIRGILTMQSNADIVLATGDGNLRFDCPENEYCSTQFVGNNTISLTGTGRTDRVLVVTGKGLDLTGVVSLSLTTGKVELGTNTEIVVDGSLTLNTVKVTKVSGVAETNVHKGIVINSLTGKTISIQHSRFEYAQIGLTKSSTSTISPLSLTETTFGYCTFGLKTFGGGCTLSKVRFDNCGIGWKATDMSAASEFNGFAENNISAVEYAGNSSAHLYVYESTFRDNKEEEDDLGTAIIASGEFYLTLGCNHFIENDNDVIFAHGDLFLTGSVAGNNYFNNTLINTLYLDNVNTVSLSGGDNEFIYTSNPQKVFTGTINSGINTVAMSGNYWEMLNGSTTVYDLNAALATVVNSSSASVTCSTATVETTADICEETWDGLNEVTEKITRLPQKKPATSKAAVQLYKLYPNPASNTLFLKATSGAAESNLTVKAIDVMGKTIVLHGQSVYDISQLSVGMYQIIVEQNGHILHKQKLVVSK